jgi:hypothetical protein
MTEPLLSVCIPTYNRRVYVENTVAALAPLLARAPVEIVISDDASSDETGVFLDELAAREPRARIFRQPKRLGGFANTLFVMRAARGRFAIYNADDDRLIEDGVFAAIDFLESHPDYSALYAPVEGFDLTTGRSTGLFLHSPDTVDFANHQRLELIAYICRGLTPEHAVMRTACLSGVIYDPQIYWSIELLAAAMRHGKVRFAPGPPFYRATYTHWEGERREQLSSQLMADTLSWETFRFGLEMILSGVPDAHAQRDRIAQARALIDESIGKRQSTALDFLATQARWVEFVHAYRMLALRGALPRAFSQLELIRVSFNAVATVIADYRSMHGFARVMLVGPHEITTVLTDVLSARAIDVSQVEDVESAVAAENPLLVVADAAMVEQAVERGLPRHAVRNVMALYAAFDLTAL